MPSTISSPRDSRWGKGRSLIQNSLTWLSTIFRTSRPERKMSDRLTTRNSEDSASSTTSTSIDPTTAQDSASRKSTSSVLSKMPENKRTPADASLLGLPGELRNQIYYHALVSDKMIKIIPSSHQQPGLLLVNRQIRHEALSIYETMNIFKCDAWDMQLTIPPNYETHWLSRIQYKSFFITMRGKKDWGNLKGWLARYARHEVPGLAAGQPTTEAEILAQAFEIVHGMLGKFSFEEMGPVLEAWIRSLELAGVEFDFQ